MRQLIRARLLRLAIASVPCHALGGAVFAQNAPRTPGIQWVTRAISAPRLQHRTFESTAAGTRVSYQIYTPHLYETEPERRFPVLYWLHG